MANVWQVPLNGWVGKKQGKKIDCSGQIGIAPMGETEGEESNYSEKEGPRDGYFGRAGTCSDQLQVNADYLCGREVEGKVLARSKSRRC